MRTRRLRVCAAFIGSVASVFASTSAVAQLDLCGAERSGGTAAQCLFTLRAALDLNPCAPECACDLDRTGGISATDALLCLKHVIGALEVGCPCPTCTSASLRIDADSTLDAGWNGYGHGQSLAHGYTLGLRFVERCNNAPEVVCASDGDCATGGCSVACDCDDPEHSQCELSGPTGQRYCRGRDLAPCETNADCPASACVPLLGPPQPHSTANTPVCVVNYVPGELSGTYDALTGDASVSVFARSLVTLGESRESPCPRCGAPNQNPKVGDQFACEGGTKDGQPCTVEAVHDVFGGVSAACAPHIPLSILGLGTALRLRNLTTETAEATASIPCLTQATGKCIDDLSECTTNADCARCTEGLSPCTSNTDCSAGSCAIAPDQPISCGLWCHCGFCNDDPSRPCISAAECDEGETCSQGDATTGGQEQPNACGDLVCGRTEPERCCAEGDPGCETPTGAIGHCSESPHTACDLFPQHPLFGVCETENVGECVADNRPCFEHGISRSGEASPLAGHCAADGDFGACASDVECETGTCQTDTATPSLAAVFCTASTASGAVNAASGLLGPSALTLSTRLVVCRCGDFAVGCDEECDDGNNLAGDGCDASCRAE